MSTDDQELPNAADDLYAADPTETVETTPDVQETQETQTPGVAEHQETQPSEQETQEPQEQPAETSTPPAAQPLSEERIAEITAKVLATASKKPEPEPELTPEQVEKLLNPVRVTKESIAKLLKIDLESADDEQVAQLQKLANDITKNSTSVASLLFEQRVRQLEAKYEPVRQFYEQAQARAHIESFHAEYPQLKQYGTITQAVAKTISPTKPDGTYKTAKEIFSEVAAGAMQVLKASGINITASQARTQSPAANAVPQMAQRQQPGRSAASQAKGKQNDPDNDIYDD